VQLQRCRGLLLCGNQMPHPDGPLPYCVLIWLGLAAFFVRQEGQPVVTEAHHSPTFRITHPATAEAMPPAIPNQSACQVRCPAAIRLWTEVAPPTITATASPWSDFFEKRDLEMLTAIEGRVVTVGGVISPSSQDEGGGSPTRTS